MNGIHDLGGMHGFGPIPKEEAAFRQPWEMRVIALIVALGALRKWSIDQARLVRESQPPAEYMRQGYFERLLNRTQLLLLIKGLVTEEELAGHAAPAPIEGLQPLRPEVAVAAVSKRGSYERPSSTNPKFRVGEKVFIRDINPRGHTRLPRYARGKIGVIQLIHGHQVYADANASGLSESPRWLYAVTIAMQDVIGGDAEAFDTVTLDAYETYLQPLEPITSRRHDCPTR